MKRLLQAEKLILEDIIEAGKKLQQASRGLQFGDLLAMIRVHLGMSQETLAERAGVPQSTISRIESSTAEPNLSTLKKITEALCCDFLVVPIPKQSIEEIRCQQALKIARENIRYLQGTMSLEKQEPDRRFLEKMLEEETKNLLKNSNKQLWK